MLVRPLRSRPASTVLRNGKGLVLELNKEIRM